MANIELRYGNSHFYFEFDEERFQVLEPPSSAPPLSDFQINEKFDSPIGSGRIEEIVDAGDSVLIVVPDATREAASGQVANLLIRRLIASGVAPFDISIIFATGIHRPVTEEEKKQILSPFLVQRVKTLDHRPRDIARIVRLGETSAGIPVELNRSLVENDRVFLIGAVGFHYFAGFTGGRKLICPGLASSRTISATHKLAFDCGAMDRTEGVGSGLLDGNPVHEAFAEAAAAVPGIFCINTIVNEAGGLTDLYCGSLAESHRAACDAFSQGHTIRIPEKRGLVIASCGGSPFDINMIQAHKTLEAASHACIEGGTIILLAECRDGLGRDDFLKWFEAGDSRELAEKLCEAYQVNGQTAWSLLRMAERFDIRIVTGIHEGKVGQMRLRPYESLAAAAAGLEDTPGYLVPFGSKVRLVPGQTVGSPQ